jgi:hypothetical protein
MKALCIFCALCCLAAFYRWPIGYYTFLRVMVSIGSIIVIYNTLKYNYLWAILFSIILIFFNPILPIYMYRKSIWLPLDIVVGILFLLLAFWKKKEHIKEMARIQTKGRFYKRDRIIISKANKK